MISVCSREILSIEAKTTQNSVIKLPRISHEELLKRFKIIFLMVYQEVAGLKRLSLCLN